MIARWESSVLVLTGEFDAANDVLIRDAIGAAVGHGYDELVIDMAEVTFCDSTGLAALIDATNVGLNVTIRRPSQFVRRLLAASGVDQIVTITDT